jgi:hypothetical protein
MNASFPSLAGIERALAEDWHWACRVFTWAVGELRITEAAAMAQPRNERLWKAAADTADAIREQLADWEPPHRAN